MVSWKLYILGVVSIWKMLAVMKWEILNTRAFRVPTSRLSWVRLVTYGISGEDDSLLIKLVGTDCGGMNGSTWRWGLGTMQACCKKLSRSVFVMRQNRSLTWRVGYVLPVELCFYWQSLPSCHITLHFNCICQPQLSKTYFTWRKFSTGAWHL